MEVIGLNVIQVNIAGLRLWASKRRGWTFTLGVNALYLIQGFQKIDP